VNDARVRRAALLLTALTGFTGLVYEVTWEKLLATLLGSHSAAAAAVLGFFLGGLAAGYALFGRVTLRLRAGSADGGRSRLLVVYGAVEAAIGVYALGFVPLLGVARSLSLWLPGLSGPAAFAVDAGLAALLVLPGAVLMGGTIPFLTQGLSRGLSGATRVHAQVYALNTLGATAGALAAGFWLLPWLGLHGVLIAMAVVNLAAGAAFAGIGSRLDRDPAGGAEPRPLPSRPGPGFGVFASLALLVGFAMMSVQTVLLRLAALALGASQLSFAMVVAAFVGCIALGSFAVSALPRIPRALLVLDLWALAAVLGLLYAPLENVTWGAHVLRSSFGTGVDALPRYSLAVFAALLGTIGPAVVLSGAALPLVFHHLRRSPGDLGARAGALYGWNTLGSLLGALLGGYVLLYWLDLHHVYRLAVVAVAVAAGLATLQVLAVRPWKPAAAVAGVLGLVAVLPPWSPDRLAAGLFRERRALPGALDGPDTFFAANARGRILFHVDDPTATISVKEGIGRDGRIDRAIVTNGKSDGFVVGERTTTGLLALVPALLARRAERAFVVGYGTGVTAAELALLDETREVVVAEISPGVVEAAPFFDPANGFASRHPQIRIVEGDAYRTLLRSDEPFDVIVSEPSNPWVAGVEMLYSREFLSAARDRLREGGVHGQWFHLYDADAATIGLVLRTYASVFEHVAVWYTLDSDLLLIGVRDAGAALDIERLMARAGRPDFASGLLRSGIRDFPSLVAHELLPLDVLDVLALEGPLHTLLHPRLGYAAARAFFSGGVAELPLSARFDAAYVGRQHSLIRRLAVRSGGTLGERDRAAVVAETCVHRPRECAALVAEWRREVPDSAERDRLFAAGGARWSDGGRPTEALLAQLGPLYSPAVGGPTGEDPVAEAMAATNLYAQYYHHAAPFNRAALASYWQRCEREPAFAVRCREKRSAAESALGALEPSGVRDVPLEISLGAVHRPSP
jgi:spermidine synthase